jgi:hypothetical protein
VSEIGNDGVKAAVLSAYRYWTKSLNEAGVDEGYWNIPHIAVKNSLIGDKVAIDFIYNRPDIWTKKYFILIDGFSESQKTPQDEVRRLIGMSVLVSAVSYASLCNDFSSNLLARHFDFSKFLNAILDYDKIRRDEFCDMVCSADFLFISEMKSEWALHQKALVYALSRIDEIMRSRIDGGKTTIISFRDGCSACLRRGIGVELDNILKTSHMLQSSIDYDRRIVRLTTRPKGDKTSDQMGGTVSNNNESSNIMKGEA